MGVDDETARVAAYLAGMNPDLTQAEIGRQLGHSQSHIQRALDRAEAAGWLTRKPRFHPERFTEEQLREIQARVFPNRLLEQLADLAARRKCTPVRHVTIFPTTASEDDARVWDLRAEAFGRSAAGRVGQLIPRMKTCMVSWGFTVMCTVKALGSIVAPDPNRPPIRFAAACGEPTKMQASRRLSASMLVAELDDYINHRKGFSVTLGPLPCAIPSSFGKEDRGAFDEYLRRFTNHEKVFKEIAPEADTLLSGVGTPEHIEDDNILMERIAGAKLTVVDIKYLSMGDIAGVYLPRSEAAAGHLKALNDQWTGIGLEQIRGIAGRAHGGRRPGVIVLGLGKEKAEIMAAVAEGLATELVMDSELAIELGRLLEEKGFRKV